MQLALGTVQFGVAYGVAGRGTVVPEAEVREILLRAAALGIRVLDTAAAYGDIEERLSRLCGESDFEVVSKIGPLPDPVDAQVVEWTVTQAEKSRQRLGERLRALMLHRAEDLVGPHGAQVWDALSEWGAQRDIAIGVSAYDPATVRSLHERFAIEIAQLPGNALDQRIPRELQRRPGLTVHLRSAFLQGLLLMDAQRAVERLPGSKQALERWSQWCSDRRLSPLAGALAVVKSFDAVDCCVVGVDSSRQLEEIAGAWERVAAMTAGELHCDDPQITDPRLWRPN